MEPKKFQVPCKPSRNVAGKTKIRIVVIQALNFTSGQLLSNILPKARLLIFLEKGRIIFYCPSCCLLKVKAMKIKT